MMDDGFNDRRLDKHAGTTSNCPSSSNDQVMKAFWMGWAIGLWIGLFVASWVMGYLIY